MTQFKKGDLVRCVLTEKSDDRLRDNGIYMVLAADGKSIITSDSIMVRDTICDAWWLKRRFRPHNSIL